MWRLLAAVIGLAGRAPDLPAQAPVLRIAVGESVALRIPPSVFRDSLAGIASRPIGVARCRAIWRRPAGVNGSDDWATTGLLPVASSSGSSTYMRDHLSAPVVGTAGRSRWRGLLISMALADTAFIFSRLFAVAADTLAVQTAAFDAVRQRVFGTAAGALPLDVQTRILRNGSFRARYDSVKVLSFEGRPYLQLTTHESSYTCGIGSANDPHRLGEAIEEVGFPVIRDVGFHNDSLSGPGWDSLSAKMSLKPADCGNGSSGDVVTLFVSADAVHQFTAGEVTGQQLLDRSAAVFKGKRVDVLLRRPT